MASSSITSQVSLRWYQKFYIPKRFCQFILLITGTLLVETLSTSIKYIIKYMIVVESGEIVPFCNHTGMETKRISDSIFLWSSSELLFLHISYLWGLLIGSIPAMFVCDRIGGKYPLLMAVGGTSTAFLLFCVFAIVTNGNVWVLILPRVLQGFAAAFLDPALHALLVRWSPPKERSLACGTIYGTVILSVSTALIMTNVIAQGTDSWKPIFYVGTGITYVWCLLWFFFGLNTFYDSKNMKAEEREFLEELLGEGVFLGKRKIPFSDILRCGPMWGILISCTGQYWTWTVLVLEIPLYLKFVYKYEYNADFVMASVSYFVMALWVAALGAIADCMINRKAMNALTARKIYVTFGSMGPPVFFLASTFLFCNYVFANISTAIGIGLLGFYYIGTRTNMLEVAPNFAGFTVAASSLVGVVLGNVTPIIVYHNINLGNKPHWRQYFLILTIVRGVTNLPFIFLASSDIQYWDRMAYKHRKVEMEEESESSESSLEETEKKRSSEDIKISYI